MPERAQVILDAIRAQLPRTSVRLVVNSHHHLDHIGGLRHFFASQIPVMTHWGNVELLRQFARANQASNDAGPALIGVRERVTIGSGDRAIQIYIAPNRESETFLVGYIPALRLLWAPDIGEGGASEDMRRLVQSLGVPVEQVAPGHRPAWRRPTDR